MKKIIVFYHAECTDGFTAAWAAHKKFGEAADYLPIFHSTPMPKNLKRKEIYFLDIVPPMEILQKIMKENQSVTVIDHHITREQEAKVAGGLYALNHSGAALAWQYFFPKKQQPLLIRLVEEEDLWQFKTKGVKEMLAYIKLRNFDFETWSELASKMDKASFRKKVHEAGATILEYRMKMVAEIVRNANLVKFEGLPTYAVNSTVLVSEVGNYLAEKKLPPIGIIWSQRQNRMMISLRSNGTVDVSKLAEKYGGGGHKAAAGFSLPIGSKLPWTYLKQK